MLQEHTRFSYGEQKETNYSPKTKQKLAKANAYDDGNKGKRSKTTRDASGIKGAYVPKFVREAEKQR